MKLFIVTGIAGLLVCANAWGEDIACPPAPSAPIVKTIPAQRLITTSSRGAVVLVSSRPSTTTYSRSAYVTQHEYQSYCPRRSQYDWLEDDHHHHHSYHSHSHR